MDLATVPMSYTNGCQRLYFRRKRGGLPRQHKVTAAKLLISLETGVCLGLLWEPSASRVRHLSSGQSSLLIDNLLITLS